MKNLTCDRCGAVFGYGSKGPRTRVSCPSCGSLIDIQVSATKVRNPTFKVSRVSPREIVMEPEKLLGKYRCLKCAKLFNFEKDPEDRYTKPHCPCGSPEVVPVTPLARMVPNHPDAPSGAKIKLSRFIRRNFKALVEARKYFETLEPTIKRLALPPKAEERYLRQVRGLVESLLEEAEAHKNEILRKRIQEMGVANGEAGL